APDPGRAPMTRTDRRKYQAVCEILEDRQLLAAQPYYLVNAASGKVIDDNAFSTANGQVMQQYQLNGGTNQQWTLTQQSDRSVVITNVSSNKVLDDPAFSTQSGVNIQQYQPNGGSNQHWKRVQEANGADEFINVASGKALDDRGSAQGNGVKLEQNTITNGA